MSTKNFFHSHGLGKKTSFLKKERKIIKSAIFQFMINFGKTAVAIVIRRLLIIKNYPIFAILSKEFLLKEFNTTIEYVDHSNN
jgi:hypothetical protein